VSGAARQQLLGHTFFIRQESADFTLHAYGQKSKPIRLVSESQHIQELLEADVTLVIDDKGCAKKCPFF